MKKISLVAAIVLASIAGSVYAADSQTVPVTATIQGVCKFSVKGVTVAFGSIDPSVGGELTQPMTVRYRCTKGITPTVTAGAVTAMTLGGAVGAESIAFTVDTFSAIATVATGFSASPTPATTTIRIAQTAYQDASAGAYAGSVLVNIAP